MRRELTATRRPSRLRDKESGSIRKQEQLTFDFEDSAPSAPHHFCSVFNENRAKVVGGESGRTKTQSDNYWSSTENDANNAWNVNFNNCNVNNNNKTNNNYVRAVRSSKWQGRLPREAAKPISRGLSSPFKLKKDIFSFENIYSAYIKCRRRKRNTANALKFELNLEENLIDLQEQLVNRSYRPGRSILFAAKKPKLREIFAADFKDRVVHHILVRELEKIWEPRFISDSYACRKGKGIHGAAMRTQKFLRQVSSNGTRRAYYIKLDIRSFFNTLNKDILFEIISKKLKNPELLWLIKSILYHDCTKNYLLRDREGLLKKVPLHKSLFSQDPNTGLPIGNLTSQFFANVYLDRLDQYIKRELKCRQYLRYADDFVLLSTSQEQLKEWMAKIEEFIKSSLSLELNSRKIGPASISNGIDFIGYVIHHNHILVRRRVINNLKERLSWFGGKLTSFYGSDYIRFRYDYDLLDQLFCCLNSYLGHFRWANSYRLVESLWSKFGFLRHYFDLELSTLTLKRKYPLPRIYSGLPDQYESLLSHFSGYIIFFQMGNFYEFFNQQALLAEKHLNLKIIRGKRWWKEKAGFPVIAALKYGKRARENHLPVVEIKEKELLSLGELKERLPFQAYLPLISAT